ncbi:TFIIA [Hepatospora eriocheir]|uniref:TFIIA n=1 Tax=Hepatospora eriocheir TaxID=1081669 RepID=A0A1X0QG64_9MICR|nr:TFIIA [Hepatospora eriocheir]
MPEIYRILIVGRALMDLIEDKIKNNLITEEQGKIYSSQI